MNRFSTMMARFAFKILMLLLALPLSAQSGLNKKDFSKFWFVESESPDYTVKFLSDTCELTAPKGLTLWRRLPMSGNSVVEYDAMVVNEGHKNDRTSDLNCFWMASDPQHKDIWARTAWRNGIFPNCYSLQLYYMGYGGNYNTTTRFRRYTGDERGVSEAAYRSRRHQEC